MSLYSEYIKERTNKEIIETDKGFLVYSFTEDSVYIEDIYTKPDFRQSSVASDFADQVVVIAKEKGFTKILGSVVPTANNSTISLKVLLSYGFKLHSSTNNFILFMKEI